MPFQKSITLSSGVTGDYLKVTDMQFKLVDGVGYVTAVLSLFQDDTPGLTPLGKCFTFQFTLTAMDIASNPISTAHTKMLAQIDALVPPIDGIGPDVSRYPELVGAIIVA